MKKELNITYKNFNLDFYYDNRSFKPSEVKNIKQWLMSTIKVLKPYLDNDLKLKTKNIECFNLSLSVVGDQRIRTINNEHRNKDKLTDVLTFPAQDTLRKMSSLEIYDNSLELGDVVICKSVCIKQSKQFGISFYDEFIHLFIHGFLHICGFDHEISVKEEKLMESLEEKLIKKIKKPS